MFRRTLGVMPRITRRMPSNSPMQSRNLRGSIRGSFTISLIYGGGRSRPDESEREHSLDGASCRPAEENARIFLATQPHAGEIAQMRNHIEDWTAYQCDHR